MLVNTSICTRPLRKNDDFYKKKKNFRKIFSKKSRGWFIKHLVAEAKSRIEKIFFFEKVKKMAKI